MLSLWRQVLEQGRYFISYSDELNQDLASIERSISRAKYKGALFLVAREDCGVVGFCLAQTGPVRRLRGTARLEIVVSESHRGQGVGRALMKGLIHAAEEDVQIIKLSLSVFSDNVAAVALYKSLGFEQEGYRVAEYLEDDGTTRDDLLLFRMVQSQEARAT